MLNTILGSKQKMSQTFVQGTRVPVTVVKAGPCVVTQVKSDEKDGYWAIQLGFGEKKEKRITKPIKGHLKAAYKNKKKAARFLREVKLNEKPDLKVGDEVKVSDVFKRGDVVSVTGVSKGKGFAGVVKRWDFKGSPRSHGQSATTRKPGSIGQGTDPGRVWKGKKMAGRMGGQTATIKNLIVVEVDDEDNEIKLSGPIPGGPGNLLIIKKIASGALDELVEEAPQQRVVEGERPEEEEGEEGQAKEFTPEKAEETKEESKSEPKEGTEDTKEKDND